ncbi:MAG: hypothetical protein ACAI44_00285 [Candidatus Sericytochromatia bacterium]
MVSLDTGNGQIRLHMDLPYPKAYKALRAYQAYEGFGTKALEEGRINKIRVTITGTSTDFLAEKVIPLTQGGMVATIKVPLGKNFLIKVQGMDDLDEVPGAVAKGVFSVESSETTPDVEINPLSTAVAQVLENVNAKSRDKSLVTKIDTDKLKALIVEGKSAANPYLVNFSAFADAIIAAKGLVPSIVPAKPVLKPGNLAGTLTGLKPGDAAVVFSNDPVSEPFIVVAPPLTGNATAENTKLEFRIDNIPSGDWIVRVVASGYQVQGDKISSLNELSATKKISIKSDAQTTQSFDVKPVDWDVNLTNASGNIGSSDQPDAIVDGSDSIHMAWRQDGFQENEEAGSIFYSHWNGKTWSTDNRFISPPGDNKYRGARNPAVAVGIDRTPHVVWSANSNNTDFRGRRVVYSHFDGVSWSAPLVLSTVSPQDDVTADYPDVAINPVNGQVYAVWSQIKSGVKTVYITQLQNGQWLEPIQLSEASTQSLRPLVNIGTDGWIRVTWQVEDSSRVQYIEWDGKQFSAIEEVPFNQSASGQRPRNLVGSLDRLNRLHLMLRVENTIQYLFRSNNSWSKAEFVHEVAGEALAVRSNVAMAVDNLGNVNAAWSSALVDGTPVLRYRRRTPAGWDQPEGFSGSATASPSSFPTPTPLPTASNPPQATPAPGASFFPGYDDLPASENKVPAEEPQVVVDSRGRLSVIWSNSSSDPVNSEIYHTLRAEPGD